MRPPRRPSAITCARVLAAAVVLPRIVRTAVAQRAAPRLPRTAPTVPAGRQPATEISVVVAARDEALRIVPLLERLGDRYEVIVVDDDSTDETAEIARRHGAIVVDVGPRPPGWAGKTWAMQRGADTASGEWVVHLDADVRPDHDLPADAVAHARRHGLAVLTVTTSADAPPVARLLHASMLATLVYRFGGPGAATPGRELANGQCLVARRELLVGPGGWASIADHVTEDVALVRSVSERGATVAMVDGGPRAEVAVSSFGEVWHGWGRSIGLPGVEARCRIALDVVVLALTMPFPLARLASCRSDCLDVVLVAARWATAFGVRSAYRPAGAPVLLAPFADPLALAAVAAAAARRHVTWRGRRLEVPRVGRRARPVRTAPRRTS